MMFLARALVILSTAAFATGCAVYKSGDRDFFDGNAQAGAPQASGQSSGQAAGLSIDACSFIREEDLGLVFEAQSINQSRAVSASSSACYLQGHDARGLSPFSVRCTLDLAPAQDMSDTLRAKIVTGEIPGRAEFGAAASFKLAASRDLSWSCKTLALTSIDTVPADHREQLSARARKLEQFVRLTGERALGSTLTSPEPLAP